MHQYTIVLGIQVECLEAIVPLLEREEVRKVDERAIEMGLPGVVLMENAALGLTDIVVSELEKRGAPFASWGVPGGWFRP